MILMYFLDGPLKGQTYAIRDWKHPVRFPVYGEVDNRGWCEENPYEMPKPSIIEYRVVGWHNGTAITAMDWGTTGVPVVNAESSTDRGLKHRQGSNSKVEWDDENRTENV